MRFITPPQHKEESLISEELLTFIIKFNPIIVDIANIDNSHIKEKSNYSVFCDDILVYLSKIFSSSEKSNSPKVNFDTLNIDVLRLMIESFYQDWNNLDFFKCKEQIPQIICSIHNLFISYKIQLGIDKYMRIAGDDLLVAMNNKYERRHSCRDVGSNINQKYCAVMNSVDPVI